MNQISSLSLFYIVLFKFSLSTKVNICLQAYLVQFPTTHLEYACTDCLIDIS